MNTEGNEPVTQAEFAATMGAIKQDMDQLATKADLETIKQDLDGMRDEMATKADIAALDARTQRLERTTERILELMEGFDEKLKPLVGLPEEVRRLKEAVFH